MQMAKTNIRLILFNPRSNRTTNPRRFPTSIGELSATVEGLNDYEIVDGNLIDNSLQRILGMLNASGTRDVLGISVMPGVQVVQATEISRRVKAAKPETIIIWGGFFPSLHSRTVLESSFVDAVVVGQGDEPLAELLRMISDCGQLDPAQAIPGVVTRETGNIHARRSLHPMTERIIPYERFQMELYLNATGISHRTLSYASGMGCRHSCSFCAIKTMYNQGPPWVGQSLARFQEQVQLLTNKYACDGIRFVDADQFANPEWAVQVLDILGRLNVSWGGYATVEFLSRQDNSFWSWLRQTGCRTLYVGVESYGAHKLMRMSKRIGEEAVIEIAQRFRKSKIIPEFSFILLSPDETEESLRLTIKFVRRLKKECPLSNIIIYFYSSVSAHNCESSELAEPAPSLEQWCTGSSYRQMVWNEPYLRHVQQNKSLVKLARNFRRVLYSRHPKVTDFKNSSMTVWVSKALAYTRYKFGFYSAPVELEVFDRLFNINKIE
jgi:Radical SAM superfamily/B12 binding domain